MAHIFPVQQQRYPKSSQFLGEHLPLLQRDRPEVWQQFLYYSHLDVHEATAALSLDGSAPMIFVSTLGSSVWGQFVPALSWRIEISSDVCARFETAAGNPEAGRFLTAKVLHELCHWGCFRKQVPELEEVGERFESAAFGAYLLPWWTSGAQPITAELAPSVFNDPSLRAQACKRLLSEGENMPGKLADPAHAVFSSADVALSLPRGYRNNNPGNIRPSASMWTGLSDPAQMTDFQQQERAFCVFREPEWGLRAMMVILRNYKLVHGLVTPRSMIARWAPASDNNNVNNYSSVVAAALGVSPDSLINVEDDDTMLTMTKAMVKVENGAKVPYSDIQFRAALRLI
ncbi:hypothetical protein [Herbaspirillum huttiense]|uniref:hypothetical protein n=1 Tax=Herbaspirillum huttiense TaxID=863372 RepID=UPI0039B0F1AA